MTKSKKCCLTGAVASAIWLACVFPATAQAVTEAERLDTLLSELAEPDREDWRRIESEILRLWSRSGSEAMDLLLRRGMDAMEAEDHLAALDHLSALTDHAPEFSEGWSARARVFTLIGEFDLAQADIERALSLNPRNFGAIAALAHIFEETGQQAMALRALRAFQELNPNRQNVNQSVERLERLTGVADL